MNALNDEVMLVGEDAIIVEMTCTIEEVCWPYTTKFFLDQSVGRYSESMGLHDNIFFDKLNACVAHKEHCEIVNKPLRDKINSRSIELYDMTRAHKKKWG